MESRSVTLIFYYLDLQTAFSNQLGHPKYFHSAKQKTQRVLYLDSYANGVENGL